MSAVEVPAPLRAATSAWCATPSPAAIVIFGATGDLTQRKLLPGPLQPGRPAAAAARDGDRRRRPARTSTDEEFRDAHARRRSRRTARVPVDEDVWDGFARRLRYVSVPFDDPGGLRPPARPPRGARRRARDARQPALLPGDRARSSSRSSPSTSARAGLAEEGDGAERFARLVVEKPFGADLASAPRAERPPERVFRERQVYRIDHYLGKETVQNILVLRFGNAIFEPIWNRRYVDHVQITVAEDLGVGTRGGYYDQTGALRDIVQNHMLQVLSIVAMEPPARFEAATCATRRSRCCGRSRPSTPTWPHRDAVRGQYGAGLDRRRARARLPRGGGRRPELATPRPSSPLRLEVDNWRWAGHAVLPAHRQAPAAPGDRGGDPVQAGAAPALRLDRGRDRRAQPPACCASSPTRAPRCGSWPRCPGPQIDLRVGEHGLRLRQLVPAQRRPRPTSGSCSTRCSATRRSSPAGTRWSGRGRSSTG